MKRAIRPLNDSSWSRRILHLLIKKSLEGLTWLLLPVAFLLKLAKVRVLAVKFQAIGHLAVEPDLYLREHLILNNKHRTILFPPFRSFLFEKSLRSAVCNQTLLDCWRKHFFVIDNLFLYILLYPILKSPLLQYDCDYYLQLKFARNYRPGWDYISIHNAFRDKFEKNRGFSPLLSLDIKQKQQGRAILEKLGVPKDAWFVCFNCREEGYYAPHETTCRNAKIEHLQLALEEIVQRGGWCIRTGSAFASPLPPSLASPRIIDYPHTEYVSDFMDIFLVSHCRFFLGNNSGLTVTASLFGVPCIWVNVVPFGILGVASKEDDIVIFKLQKSKVDQKWIPFSICLQSFLSTSINSNEYNEFQIELTENAPEEILDTVLEMFDRLENRLQIEAKDQELQLRFKSMLSSFNPSKGSQARVGKMFLRKYEHLLI
ncbi:MAG: TIGR04372 family glycosyltransferase [Chlamydiia bacterium]|nr:TIGR04372 family glycosyltransferase [Chlamydiia bacterium]